MEKWPVDIFGKLLPRHLELIYMINDIFLDKIKKFLPKKNLNEKLKNLSLIEEGETKYIRICHLCIVACHKVILASEIQKETLLSGPYKDFVQILPKAFVVI